MDAAQHICATGGRGRHRQRRRGKTAGTASAPPRSIRQAVGFRNVLVHDYLRVNDDIVIDRLKALGDFQDFVSPGGSLRNSRLSQHATLAHSAARSLISPTLYRLRLESCAGSAGAEQPVLYVVGRDVAHQHLLAGARRPPGSS